MASQVGGDLSKIQTGPCKMSLDAAAVGHTQDGVKFNVKPDIRKRMVDEYGTHTADLIYQGEEITISTVLAEKTMAVLNIVFMWGYAVSATVRGWGKIPGTKGSDLAQEMILHPLDIVGTTEDVTFYKVVVSESAEVNFGVITAERVFGVTFTCLIDESQNNGQLLGKIGGPAA
jgi:hypothetical protein